MAEQMMRAPAAAPRRDRGLGYALIGGLGVTLITFLIGGALQAWLIIAQSDTIPADLLAADTQLYVGLAPIISDVPEPARVAAALRENLGISDPAALAGGVEGRLGLELRENVLTWLGSEMALAVRGLDDQAIGGEDPGARLLESADVLIILASRNDPQAQVFLEKHLEIRRNRGEQVKELPAGDTVVYVSEGGSPTVMAAMALIEHHIVFGNRADALVAMANRVAGGESLADVPSFAAFREQLTPDNSNGFYSDGSAAAAAARSALREVILKLGE